MRMEEGRRKPYFHVPIAGEKALGQPPWHDRFDEWTGRLELEVEVRSGYLHVGSGLLGLTPDGKAYSAFARRDGQLVIPGTSIKGAVRSVVEAISRSCVSQARRDEEVPSRATACNKAPRRNQVAIGTLCPACRLFGTTSYRGRVFFTDAVALGPVEPKPVKVGNLWPPRQAAGDRKFYRVGVFHEDENALQRDYRYVEAVPRGTRFLTALVFESATTEEMGLLVRALGIDTHPQDQSSVGFVFLPKLGGAKPRCLGAVRFWPRRTGLRVLLAPSDRPGDLLRALYNGGQPRPLVPTLRTWLERDDLVDRKAWSEFKEKAKADAEPCPQELY